MGEILPETRAALPFLATWTHAFQAKPWVPGARAGGVGWSGRDKDDLTVIDLNDEKDE